MCLTRGGRYLEITTVSSLELFHIRRYISLAKCGEMYKNYYTVTSCVTLTKGNDEYELDGGKDEKTGVEDDHQGRLTPGCRQHRPEGKDDIEQ